MKYISTLLLASVLAAATAGALAQTEKNHATLSPGGYSGPSAIPVMSVKKLLAEGKDDQYVTLKGSVIRHLKKDRYIFRDETGELQIEIGAHYFPKGKTFGATDVVEITGEFEKKLLGEPELDVKQTIVVH